MQYKPEALRKKRETWKMTQEQLAKTLGISVNTLASYESGKTEPDSEMLVKMATVFNITVDELLRLLWGPDTESLPSLAKNGIL